MGIAEQLLFSASLQLQPYALDRAAAVFGHPDDGCVVSEGQQRCECSSSLQMHLNGGPFAVVPDPQTRHWALGLHCDVHAAMA